MKSTGNERKSCEESDVEKIYDNDKTSEKDEQKRISNENSGETASHDIEV